MLAKVLKEQKILLVVLGADIALMVFQSKLVGLG
jgi:hypothetical protein